MVEIIRNNKQWEKLEEDIKKDIKGYRSPGSGNKPINKSDVYNDSWFIEAKWTAKNKYSVERKLINMLFRRATMNNKTPALVVRFGNNDDYYAIIIEELGDHPHQKSVTINDQESTIAMVMSISMSLDMVLSIYHRKDFVNKVKECQDQ